VWSTVPARTVTRKPYLIWAAASFLVLLALSVMVQVEWPRLEAFDRGFGDGFRGWALQHATVIQILHVIEDAFGTVALTIYTTVLAAALFARRHRRAAYWTVGVMLAASLTTYFLKRLFERARPELEDPIHTLDSFAFPSGHSSGIASGMGVAIVLTLMLVRRRGVRRGLVWLWVSLIVLVAADRILLGVHALSDVVAGLSVGLFWVAVGMMVYHPAPRTRVLEQFTSPVPSTRQLAVVLNPIKVEDITAFKVMVEQMAEDSGWGRPEWYQTTIEDPGKSMAEAAAIAGAELVLVCGGDGTVRTVCAELAGTGIPVGVIPAGTGNLLARNLGIPLYLQAAIDVALNGQDRAIDLVAISGDGLDDEHFMVMAGMGFDAAIMEGANEQIKARVGWLAYVVAGLRNLMFPAVRLEISVDDGPFTKHRARTVVVGNVGYLQAGIPLLPDAAIDDGVLDVVLVAPARFVSWVPLAFRVLSKNKRTDAALDRMTGRKVSIRAAHDTPRQLDGDSIGMGKELHAECIHGRLLVRVPR
jgi:YegS/Rv2252/BmrU family lipid kinase